MEESELQANDASGHPETLPRLLADAAERFGARTAVIDGEERLTYGELGASSTVRSGR